MSLSQLKGLAAATTDVQYAGQTWKVRKLSATEGVAIHKMLDGKPDDSPEAIQAFFTEVIAKCVVEDDGTNQLDSEDGRATLAQVPLADLISLGEKCLDASGLTAKKNLPMTNDSPTNSASPSENPTPTTCSTS